MSKNAPYGYCPKCDRPGISRERRPDGNDTCSKKHVYPSNTALNIVEKYTDQDRLKALVEGLGAGKVEGLIDGSQRYVMTIEEIEELIEIHSAPLRRQLENERVFIKGIGRNIQGYLKE